MVDFGFLCATFNITEAIGRIFTKEDLATSASNNVVGSVPAGAQKDGTLTTYYPLRTASRLYLPPTTYD